MGLFKEPDHEDVERLANEIAERRLRGVEAAIIHSTRLQALREIDRREKALEMALRYQRETGSVRSVTNLADEFISWIANAGDEA